MKLYKLSLALFLGLGAMATTSCEDKLDVTNPNQQTTGTFGFNADDLEECVIAAYNHIRMEGSSARGGKLTILLMYVTSSSHVPQAMMLRSAKA